MKKNNDPEVHDKKIELRTYTVADVQIILGCGREAVYELMKKKEFRWVRLAGPRGGYRISRESFDAWLDGQD